jgi:hypothetical protein
MPFTASHAAAVMPFARRPLVTSALVIGSMVPDLPLFLPGGVDYSATHSLAGVVSLDALLGLVAFAVWHFFFAPALVDVLPRKVQRELAPAVLRARPRLTRWTRLPWVYASLVIGATTHIVWDAFTHEGRWGVVQVSWLAETHGPLTGATYAQHASTVVGAAVVAWWIARWCADNGLGLSDFRLRRGAQLACLAVLLTGAASAMVKLVPLLLRGQLSGVGVSAFVIATRGIFGGVVCAVLLVAGWHGRRLLRAIA